MFTVFYPIGLDFEHGPGSKLEHLFWFFQCGVIQGYLTFHRPLFLMFHLKHYLNNISNIGPYIYIYIYILCISIHTYVYIYIHMYTYIYIHNIYIYIFCQSMCFFVQTFLLFAAAVPVRWAISTTSMTRAATASPPPSTRWVSEGNHDITERRRRGLGWKNG